MILDFIIQTLLASVIFLVFLPVGLAILDLLGYERKNAFLSSALSFFVSLCFFTTLSIFPLFFVSNKIAFLKYFSYLYAVVSVLYFLFRQKKNGFNIFISFLKKKYAIILTCLLTVFIFFHGIYQTSILDEWLHRPVIKFFTQNGIFPLVNPLSPDSNFTRNYHYGSDILASAVELISSFSASESLDVLKITFAIASFFLFYGILLLWKNGPKTSLFGAFLIFFAGSSFFLWDAFTASHIFNWEDLRVFNYPFSYSLTGITWVNIPLTLSFLFAIENIFGKQKGYSLKNFAIFLILLEGFFLISEVFALLALGLLIILALVRTFQKEIPARKIILTGSVFVLAVTLGVYFFGGAFSEALSQNSGKKLISLRPFGEWGYPSEKKILLLGEYSMWYLRNFLMEIIFLIILAWAFLKKKISFQENLLLFIAIPITLIIPFIFSISRGDLNLYKLAHLGLLIIHLSVFLILPRTGKAMRVAIFSLLALGAIPGIAVNFTVQYKLTEKGESIFCSQNDLCYKQEQVDSFLEFENENPGIKRVLAHENETQKIIDLTNSTVKRIDEKSTFENIGWQKIDYIFCSKKMEKILDSNNSLPIINTCSEEKYNKFLKLERNEK